MSVHHLNIASINSVNTWSPTHLFRSKTQRSPTEEIRKSQERIKVLKEKLSNAHSQRLKTEAIVEKIKFENKTSAKIYQINRMANLKRELETKAAIKIQSAVRGFLARQKTQQVKLN